METVAGSAAVPSPRQPGGSHERNYRDQADFRAALRRFVRFSEEQSRLRGITPQQYLLLLAIRGHSDYPMVSIGTIAEALQIRHHSTSLLVDRSVHRGLLDRREDSVDRRRALVSLTREGQKILDEIMDENRRNLATLSGALFRESLQQTLESYRSASEAGSP